MAQTKVNLVGSREEVEENATLKSFEPVYGLATYKIWSKNTHWFQQ